MLSWDLAVAMIAALLAGTVSGMTGFGLALISTPLFLFVYEPPTVVVVTGIISIFINAAVMLDSWRNARKKFAISLLIPSIVGIFVGVKVLGAVNLQYLRLVIGVVVVFSALLLARDIRLPGAATRWGTFVAGATSGALSTSTGLAAPPIVLLLASRDLPKHEFRSTSSMYFLLMSIAGFGVLMLHRVADGERILLSLALVPLAIVGKALGTALLSRISERTFRLITLGIVILTGTLGATTALLALA